MDIEISELSPGRFAYRVGSVYQEWHPDLAGYVAMTEADATVCAQAVAASLSGDPAAPVNRVAAPSPTPPISARQIRLALTHTGLRDAVEAAVAAGPLDLRDWWEYSVEYYRDNPLVIQMVESLGVSPEQADALWQLGAGL